MANKKQINNATSNPRNPYQSHVVKASAGCGKTFQLSQRFLALVAAGADPATIMTVTFTRKAAAEMRERILADSGKLLAGGPEAESFDREMAGFLATSKRLIRDERGMELPPPRSARETGRLIINQSQSLRITTIDSVFKDWVAKFPVETGLVPPSESGSSSGTPLTLADDLDLLAMDQAAWEVANREALTKFSSAPDYSDNSDNSDDAELDGSSAENPNSVLNLAKELSKYSSFLWHLESTGHVDWLMNSTGGDPEALKQRLFEGLRPQWHALAGVLKNNRGDDLRSLVANADIEGLIAGKYLTGKLLFNKVTLSEKITASVAQEKSAISEALMVWTNALKIKTLREKSERACTLFNLYRGALATAKQKAGVVSFDDLLAGSSKIFSEPNAAGARFLLQRRIRHLMLDEFQDTSWPQWNIFQEIASEVLTGTEESIPGTVFLVGDEKQSIYGFRNSDPEIMSEAAASLADLGVLESPLNHSFRTCKTILDFVNAACGQMPDFPRHEPALRADGRSVNVDVGSVTILPVAENAADAPPDEKLDVDDLEALEASGLASWFEKALSGSGSHPVFDKNSGSNDDPGKSPPRPLEPRDCAVLFRAKDRIWAVERALQKAGIPTIREESGNIFEHQEVRDCMELLRFLARPGDLNALLGVAKSPFLACSDEMIAAALGASNDSLRHSPLRAAQVLQNLESNQAIKTEQEKSWLSRQLTQAEFLQPSRQLEFCLRASDYFEKSSASRPGVEAEVLGNNIAAFLDLVRSLEGNCDDNLHAVGATLRRMAAIEKLPISISTSTAEVNAVRLMTVHKSKGLEFPLVAIVDTANPWLAEPSGWLKIFASRDASQSANAGLVYLGSKTARPEGDAEMNRFLDLALLHEISEANRIWYVALTRARQYLVLSGTRRTVRQPLLDALARVGGAPLISHEICSKALQSLNAPVKMPMMAPVPLPASAALPLSVPPAVEPAAETSWQAANSPLHAYSGQKPLPLPFGVKILVASRFSEKKEKIKAFEITPAVNAANSVAMPARLAAAIGTMVHAGLEHAVRQISFPHEAVWVAICDKSLLNDGDSDIRNGLREAMAQLTSVLESAVWKDLLGRYQRHRAEVPVIMLDRKRNLHSGTVDLLLDNATSSDIMVVDFKTSQVAGDPTEHARDHGYFDQVRSYTATMKQAFPDAKIAGCIFYTRLLQTVDVPL